MHGEVERIEDPVYESRGHHETRVHLEERGREGTRERGERERERGRGREGEGEREREREGERERERERGREREGERERERESVRKFTCDIVYVHLRFPVLKQNICGSYQNKTCSALVSVSRFSHSSPNDPAKRVPGPLVKPVQKVVEPVHGHVVCCAVVEPAVQVIVSHLCTCTYNSTLVHKYVDVIIQMIT